MIITADQARSRYANRAYIRTLFSYIDTQIKRAVDNGESSLTIGVSDIYYRDVKRELESLGYTATWNIAIGTLTISWSYDYK